MKPELVTQNKTSYFSQALFWARQNWLKLTIITFLLFLILKKDIRFEVNLVAPNQRERQEDILVSKLENTVSDQFNLSPINNPKQEVVRSAPTSPEIIVVTRDNLDASKFANISVLLQPSLFQKYANQRDKLNIKKSNCDNYVNQFKTIAIAEKEKFGIPASITLAQGLLESDAGFSQLAKRNHNHFGMKCFSHTCKKGHCSNFSDDSHKDFFRIYKSNWESFRAHSQLLQNKRYKSLKSFGVKDYKNWAYGLKKAGYATDKRYAEKLIKIIEEMKLWQYD